MTDLKSGLLLGACAALGLTSAALAETYELPVTITGSFAESAAASGNLCTIWLEGGKTGLTLDFTNSDDGGRALAADAVSNKIEADSEIHFHCDGSGTNNVRVTFGHNTPPPTNGAFGGYSESWFGRWSGSPIAYGNQPFGYLAHGVMGFIDFGGYSGGMSNIQNMGGKLSTVQFDLAPIQPRQIDPAVKLLAGAWAAADQFGSKEVPLGTFTPNAAPAIIITVNLVQ